MATILNYKDKTTDYLYKPIDNNYVSMGNDRYKVTDHRLPSLVTKNYIDITSEGTEGKRHSLTWIGLDKRLPWITSSLSGDTITYSHLSPGTYVDLEVTSYIDDHVVKEHKAYTKYAMRHIKGEYFSFNDENLAYQHYNNYIYYKENGRLQLNYCYYIVPPILRIKNNDGSLSTYSLDHTIEMVKNKVKLTVDFLSVIQYIKNAFDTDNCQWVSVLYIVKHPMTREIINYLAEDIKAPGSRTTGTDLGLYELPETDYIHKSRNKLTKTIEDIFLFKIIPNSKGIRLDTVKYRYKETGLWLPWTDLLNFYTDPKLANSHGGRDAIKTVYAKIAVTSVWLNTEVQIRYNDFKGVLTESNICTIIGSR